jgi:predicted aconitase with swiveling domain
MEEVEVKIILQGRKIIGGSAEGEAVVTRQPISFLGGVNPDKGVVVERGHELEGENITGKIFIFPHGKGSTAGPYIIYAMAKRKTAPAGIINLEAEPIIAVGAAMANIPLVDRLDKNPLEIISAGDLVRIDGDQGVVEVIKLKGAKPDPS